MTIDDIKDKIYPWIKVVYEPGETVLDSKHEIDLKQDDQPIMKTWLGNLAVFYAVDTGDNFSLIQTRDLTDYWTIDQIHEISLENLQRDIEFKFSKTNFGGHGLIAGGDHEAGSLCLTDIWDWCAENINDNLIVAVPAKDMVMMVPESDKDKIEKLKEMVTDLFQGGERLLTKQLYKFDRQESNWTVWGRVE
jgi:uncharacterized protein YtpQ (UPF0354 family)